MNRKGIVLTLTVLGCLVVGLITGCSPRIRQLFLDEPRTPPPPTHRLRRDLLHEIELLKTELSRNQALEAAKAAEAAAEAGAAAHPRPVEQAHTWPEALAVLPKDVAGNADWVQALKDGAVAPRPGPDPGMPQQAVLDLDVELSTATSKVFTVVYPHAPHTRWLSCWTCHPGIFPLKKGAEPLKINMGKIRAGQYCGVCHGKVAFAVDGACSRCHLRLPAKSDWKPAEPPRGPIEQVRTWAEAKTLLPKDMAGGVDWIKAIKEGTVTPRANPDPRMEDEPILPFDVEFVPDGNPLFRAVFPHEAHTRWLTCTNCHPGIFQMQKGSNPVSMEKIMAGEYCGRCHGPVAFAVSTGCGRCHPALGGDPPPSGN